MAEQAAQWREFSGSMTRVLGLGGPGARGQRNGGAGPPAAAGLTGGAA